MQLRSLPLLLLLALVLVGCASPRYIRSEGRDATERMTQFLTEQRVHIREGNSVRLLPSGQEKFDDLFREIRKARHHVHLEYFNFRNDSISDLLFALLADKAREGVEVRALFDAFGNLSNDSPLKGRKIDSLRSLGIDIHKYDPIRFPWINHVLSRDHRKIVVIDGRTGYLGGMNIADYYIKGKPEIGSWHDMHCRVEGTAVEDLQRIFAYMWHKQTGQTLEGDSYFPPLIARQEQSIPLAVVDREPRLSPKLLRMAYTQAIESADSLVRIQNPYFVPTRSIRHALERAVSRGVRVEIMVPERSDIPFTPDAMLHKLHKLARLGVEVRLYTAGFHHAKLMTIDGRLSTLGSMNLNSRSLRYDAETNIFILDKGLTAELDSLYLQDRASTIALDEAYWQRRSGWRKFVGWFAGLLTPFL